MKFSIHIHIHRFSVDIHGYIYIHKRLSSVHIATEFSQNTAVALNLLEIKKTFVFCYRLIKKRIQIISQIDRPFVAHTTVLKHHRLRSVVAIVHIN